MLDYVYPKFKVQRDREECTNCGVCIKSCANDVHVLSLIHI